jgi:GNAT superfamily N-acetyltransferase/NTP pyrophosphatase (non-canonical NTP hydrolase)
MNQYKIEFVDVLPETIEKEMQKDLVNYESSYGIDVNYKRFSMILKTDTNDLVGVINAFTAFSEVYVDDMWVHSSYRGKGYGRKLLQTLEDHFEGKGFNNINLVTNAFNAPGFYQKCGFIPEFVRVNKVNPKLTKTFFIKHFKNEVQTQGILNNEKNNNFLFSPELDQAKEKQSDALHELLYLEENARNFGFEWTDKAMVIDQAIDECREIKEAIEKQESLDRLQEEIGDLLHSAISLCAFSGFDVEETLTKVNKKFRKRMTRIKKLTHEIGLENLKGQSIDFMMELWRKAK